MRHISFGEGNYAATESMIRELLVDADPDVTLPAESDVADETPEQGSTTPETFLGSSKEINFAGVEAYRSGSGSFSFPIDQADDTFALDGDWDIATQFAEPADAVTGGSIRLKYHAAEVRMVLAGSGTIIVRGPAGQKQELVVDGTPRSYSLVDQDAAGSGLLEIEVPTGVQVYSFTFG